MKQAIVIADLGFGDAGKGSVVDYLAATVPVHTVVRYNGGAQAAHNVVTPDGRHHRFSQFGAGTFIPGVNTYLSEYMILHPLALVKEERGLQQVGVTDAFGRLYVDRRARVITPFQQMTNMAKELARGQNRHGSCGLGVGETVADSLEFPELTMYAADLQNRSILRQKLLAIRELKQQYLLPQFQANVFLENVVDEYLHVGKQLNLVDEAYLLQLGRLDGVVVFEGAQGVLLDEWRGFHPYTTWSTITYDNAQNLLGRMQFDGQKQFLGLMRAYATRHGAGPFPSEDKDLTKRLADIHNPTNPWQEHFRVGYLDMLMLRYGLAALGHVDGLVVSHVDQLCHLPVWQMVSGYRVHGQTWTNIPEGEQRDLIFREQVTRQLFDAVPVYESVELGNQRAYLQDISDRLELPIVMCSWGVTRADKHTIELQRVI